MSGKYLLDTNIVIGIWAEDSAIITRMNEVDEVFVPSIVLGELHYGARNSRHTDENLVRIEAFRRASKILNCSTPTAHHYGQIKHNLKKIGRPIPENDIWIAALASEYGLIVASRDRHFASVDEIEYEAW